jgi:hypothetical protein
MNEAPMEIWCSSGLYYEYKTDWSEGEWSVKRDLSGVVKYVRGDILYNQTHLIAQLFTLLEVTEATDEGRVFHPTTIRSCRVLDAEKLDKILAELKATIEHGGE